MTPPTHRKSSSTKPTSSSKIAFFSRDARVVLSLLEKTARKLGLTIRYEPIFNEGEPWESDGGLCRIQQENLLIINSSAPPDQRCQVILNALRNMNLTDVYIPPVVRQMLEKQTIHPID